MYTRRNDDSDNQNNQIDKSILKVNNYAFSLTLKCTSNSVSNHQNEMLTQNNDD